ncbi:MAG TPA: TrbC/VirB2 family protein [Elusimicrobiales bacterium]|nr:TrbC/VirB2 family protein [Elusimicrobiales bacterium]
MKSKVRLVMCSRIFWVFVVYVCIVALGMTDAHAVGEQIESSLTKLLDWVTKVLGGMALAYGIVFTGMKMSLGDDQAIKKGLGIIGGGITIFSSMYIVQLIQSIFK